MASLEKINFDGRTELGVNVSGIVGYAGKNYKDDVLLIQGLFNYIAKQGFLIKIPFLSPSDKLSLAV